jgi:Transcription termination factor
MINRRLIRIKAFKVLFSKINSGNESIQAAEKELIHSCEKSLDLYYFLMALPCELKLIAEQKIETGFQKFHPTEEELNPNKKFVNNRLLTKLENDPSILKYCEKRGLNWKEHSAFVKKMYSDLSAKDYFISYMSSEKSSFSEDLALITTFFQEELEDSEDLYTILEDMSIYWVDDLSYIINVVIKKLNSLKEDAEIVHPDIFFKEDDEEYALKLLDSSIANYGEYSALMSNYVKNWDPERLATTDIALIVMGIAEAVTFPNIPLKVTINEFVELSKYYSTPNSKLFVNGMLDRILLYLTEEGKIEKHGRGLVRS